MAFSIVGFDNSYKVPRFAAQIIYGAGKVSASQADMSCLLVGYKTSAGTMTADTDVVRVQTPEEAAAYAGAGSQLHRMALKALAAPNVHLYIAAVAEPVGTAATATLLLGGTWSTPGQWGLRIAGELLTGLVGATDTPDIVGAAMAAAITSKPNLPVSASYNSGTDTLTLTCKNVGAQGRDWIVFFDRSLCPSGFTATLTGSATVGHADRVRLGASSSGTGTEDPATIISKLLNRRYGRVAVASNDATNAVTKWKPFADSKAASTVMLYEQLVFAHNGTSSQAKLLAQGTLGGGGTYTGGLNHQRSQVLWARNCESHPCEIAAAKAAWRSITESADPVPDYDGFELPGLAPAWLGFESDTPTDAECNDVLNSGVTPLRTVGSTLRVVRSITSYCLTTSGNAGEERCLDIGDAVFPDYAVLDTALEYEAFKALNKYVQADPPEGSPSLPSGVATPSLWNSVLLRKMLDWFRNNWIEDPTANPPVSEFNSIAKRIQTAMPLLVRRVQHQLGVIARQQSNV